MVCYLPHPNERMAIFLSALLTVTSRAQSLAVSVWQLPTHAPFSQLLMVLLFFNCGFIVYFLFYFMQVYNHSACKINSRMLCKYEFVLYLRSLTLYPFLMHLYQGAPLGHLLARFMGVCRVQDSHLSLFL